MTVDTRNPVLATRLLNVDALRGFALLGILAVNIWAFADPFYASDASNPAYDSSLDHAVRFLVLLFFETKFYLLFSFLFGYSFTLQMTAAERAQESFVPRMLRRQAGLLALGLLHGAVLYYGEILSLYAVLGTVLILCRNWSPRRAMRVAITIIIGACLFWVALGMLQLLSSSGYSGGGSDAAATKMLAFRGDVWQTMSYHLEHLPETFGAIVLLQAPGALAMFFIGYAAGRVALFAGPERFWPLGNLVLRVGLPLSGLGAIGYAYAAAYRPGSGAETLLFGVGQLTAPFLTASYVIGMLALFTTSFGERVERAIAPMGKIALTNYLAQSLVLGTIFTGYGFGLIDRIPPLGVIAMVPTIFVAQMLLSRWWLRTHVYGPAEWVLRAITIGRIPAWRRHPENS